ncbi:MAG: right-handed parallel beta-helix repeat-containing protein [Bacteroidetes bacterium]|nr:right-handed parallel beta-helix repeat-containing protein [Bacteroidota bacterium]
MRKLILMLVAVFFSVYLPAQTIVAFHENFEAPSFGDSVTSSTDPVGGIQWALTTNLKNSGSYADSNKIQTGTTVYLTTNSFSTTGKAKVMLQFAQICKLLFNDGGSLDVSIDGGTTWVGLTQNEYRGTGTLIQSGGFYKFSESAYTDWLPGDTATKPTNLWWKNEMFDISNLAGNQANVKIRFKYFGSGAAGSTGRYGWLLDDIYVMASNNELMPPTLSFKNPILTDSVYFTGPFNVQAYSRDSSGIGNVQLIYNINGGPDNSIAMTNTGDSTYSADIPSLAYNNTINYRIISYDIYNNSKSIPSGYKTFYVRKGVPTVIVGTGTTTGNLSPVYVAAAADANLFSYNAFVIEKTELNTGGTIESLAFNKSDANGYNLSNATLRIYIKGIGTSTAAPTTYAGYVTAFNGATKVYENLAQNLNTAAGWQTFLCNAGSYNVTGAENIMVFVEWFRPGNATGAIPFYYNTAAGKSSIFYGTGAIPSTANTTGQRANVKLNFQSSNAAIDATVFNFASPTSPMAANQIVPVSVSVKNLGTTPLTSVNVHWMVDGQYQGMVAWPGGNLQQDFVSSPFTLGNVNLSIGPHILRAWTESPNGVPDQQTANDTMTYNVFACANMSGTFTVGTTSSNFPTLNDVYTALNNCGISGPVTFKLASGTYLQQLVFPLFNNVSAVNTITFESATGNPNDVIFQYSSTAAADNYVLRFDASNYIKVRNMTFKNLGTTYGQVIEFTNGASYNTLEGCKVQAQIGATSSTVRGITNSTTTFEHYNKIKNNEIIGGYYGVYFYGTSATKEKGNVFEGNTIKDFYYYGLYMYYQDTNSAIRNYINNSAASGVVYAFYSYYCDNSTYLRNKIIVNGSSTAYCMYMYYNNTAGTGTSLVANNWVSQSVGTAVYGIYNTSSKNIRYFYNSLNILGGTTTYYAFYSSGATGLQLKNNIFVNKGGGYSLYAATGQIDSSNYNNFYSSGTNLAYWGVACTSLAALQTASGKDQNSMNIDPQYTSVSDLHINNFSLINMGNPVPVVTDDIDGETRSTTPTIGSDEILIPTNDAGLFKINNPTASISTLNQNIKVTVKHIGSTALTSATIRYSVNGVLQTPAYNWTGNLAQFAQDSVVIGNFTFNLGINTLKVWTEMPNNVTDVFNSNDTLKLTIVACSGPMSGNYTIGGTGANFASFSDAILILKNCGVNAPVVFNVNPGSYTEQFIIPAIPGISPTNTVTFKAANNDSSSVIIDAGSGALGNFVAKFDAAQYITISKMTLKNEVATGRVIDISNGSSYITITNCVLKSQVGATSSTAIPVYSLNASLENYLTIKNNQIIGGYYGIYMYGVSTTSRETGNIIQNNVIKDFYYYGMYLYYMDGITVKGNIIQNATTSGVVYAMYSYYSEGGTYVKNDFRISSSSTNYIMYFSTNTTTAAPTLVANNFVSQSVGTGGVYAIYNVGSNNMNYYNNSINVKNGSTSSYACYVSSGTGNNFVNNNFINTGGGYAYYVSSATYVNISNYNNIYSTGANYAYWGSACANLAALKTLSGKDQNSISTDPMFFGINDLHTDNVALFAKGTTVAGVTDDIDGQTRPALPCIGADEFIVLPYDAKLKSLYTFGKLPLNGGAPHQVKSIIRNVGANTLTNLNVTLNITGANTFTNVKTTTLTPGAEDTISFDNFTPATLGLNNVKISIPLDSNMADNVLNYRQEITDSIYAYADTTAPNTYLGFNTGSGLFLAKYFINGSKLISKVGAYITNSNTIGQRLYAVILNSNGVLIDTSYSKIITASDTNSWVTFNMLNPSASSTVNNFVYVGFAQTVGSSGYYPLGCQKEVPTRRGAFYYTTTMTGGLSNLTETTQFGRFMIQATLAPPAHKDASVVQIVTPNTGCNLSNEIVSIKILDAGQDTIYGGQNTLMAYYALKTSANTLVNIVSQQVTDTILPAQNKLFTFTTPLNMPAAVPDSSYKLISWVNLQNDPYPSNDSLTKTVKSVFTPPAPVVNSPVNIIFGNSTTLTAISSDTVNWFAHLTDTAAFATGPSYTTPLLTDTTTYWVAAGHSAGSSAYVGEVAPLSTAGTGGGLTTYVNFDAISNCIVKSVDIFPYGTGAGTVTIELRTSTGTPIMSQTFNVTGTTSPLSPAQTCVLNFPVTAGTSYRLGINSWTGGVTNLYRDLTGTYPYTIPNVLSITGTSLAPYFYFFYHWNVSWGTGSGGCYSAKVPIKVNVSPGRDATVTKILSPNDGCGLMNQSVQIKIKNRGNLAILSSQNSLTAYYGIKQNNNIVNVVSEAVALNINGGDSTLFTFATPVSLPTVSADSNYTLIAWTNLIGDLNINNDTTTRVVKSKYTPPTPILATQTIAYGSTATFNYPSNDSIYWFANAADTIPLASGSQFTTPNLYDTTTYYVNASSSSGTGTNIGLLAVSTHSGGGASASGYGPELYNDGNIPVYGTTGTYLWGWVTTNGWIEYTWTTPKTFTMVKFFKDNRPMTTCTFEYWNGSAYVSFYNYNSAVIDDSVIFPPVTATKLRFNTIAGASNPNFREIQVFNTAVGCTSPKAPVTVIVTGIPALDIAVTAIPEPLNTVVTGALTPVKVKLTNWGSSTVTSAILNWSVNGLVQTSVPWSGTLTSGQSTSTITLGSYTFASGLSTIKAWSSLPNAQADMYPLNDTTKKSVMGCLTGTFTIGVGKNFPNFTAALNALDSVGVCGNVVFLVDSGVYNERLFIYPIAGAGPNSTITFTSASGDSTKVVLHYTLGSAAWAMKFIGGSYYKFNKMTLSVSGSNTWSRIMELANGANHNEISNCRIEGIPTTTTTNYELIYASGAGIDDNSFINNLFLNGGYGIYLYGSSTTSLQKRNKIIGNTFKDFYYYGIYPGYQDTLTVSGNTVMNASTSATVYGLYSYYNSNSIFTKNKIIATGTGTNYCMYMYYNNSVSGSSLVANNFVSQSIGTAVYGIYSYYSNNMNYYNNSVNVTGGSSSYYSCYMYYGTGNNVVNNIFSNTGTGYAYYVSVATSINISNYNDFYTNGTTLAYWGAACANLAALKTASTKDNNSLSVNPNFFSVSDLHLVNFDLDGKATPLSSVPDDIDGTLRNTTIPDIGADEFVLPNNDAGAVAVILPTNPTTTGIQPVKVSIKNYGVLNLTSASIRWSVNGVTQPNYAWSNNIASGSLDTVVIGNYNFTAGAANFKVWTSLPNGVADQLNMNDTMYTTIIACSGPLSGNYTIGPGTGSNFQTINNAIQVLTYCGVSAPVTFNIQSGTYNEQLLIPAIPGASAVNTITFKSLTNDSTAVIVNYNPTSSTANYVVKLNAADYIKFKYMSFTNSTAGLGRVVELANGASYNEFSNNIIQTALSTTSTSCPVYSYNTIDEKNIIANNVISGGYYGVYFYGVSTSSKEKGNMILNNVIKDFYYYGLYLYYQDSVTAIGNTIRNSAASATVYGFYSYYCDNMNYQKNKILLDNTGTTYAMYIYYNNSSSGSGLVANNFITQSASATVYGVYHYYTNNDKFYNNSINTLGGATYYSIYMYYGSNNILRNNNVVNYGGGYAIYSSVATSISASNYNNFYTTGATLGYWAGAAANLAAWKTMSGKDTNSVSLDPMYISAFDLHLYLPMLNNLGMPVAEVTDDIDGQARSATTPDIGADEYSPLQYDLTTRAILSPVIPYSQTGGNIQIKCLIKNYGADSVGNFNVVFKAGNAAAVVQTYPAYLLSNKADTVTFTTQMPVTAGPFEIKVYTDLTNDGNHLNDTLKMNYFGEYIKGVPYSENFDNTTNEWFSVENGSLWEKGVPTASVINAAHSAPNVWATKLNGNYTNSNTSYLYTPIFDNTVFRADTLKFWHWVDAELNKDGGRIEYSDNGGSTWTTMGQITPVDTNATYWYNSTTANMWTGTGAGWKQSKYRVYNLPTMGNTIQFRFVFSSDAANVNNGWAIDDFELTLVPIAQDGGVTSIVSPASISLVGDLVPVTVNIKNFGTAALTNVPVRYQVGTGAIVTGTYPGPLAPGASANYTFTQPYQVANVNYSICAYTEIFGDIYLQNDKYCKTVTVNPAQKDVGVTLLVQPSGYVSQNSSVTIKVRIRNYGTLTQTSIPVYYQRGAQIPVGETWTGTLLAGDSTDYSFTQQLIIPIGTSVSFMSWTQLPNDAYPFNDTISKSIPICSVAAAGTITGPVIVTPGSTQTYTVPTISNAISYNWVLTPASAGTITGSGTSISVTFSPTFSSASLSVNGVGTVCSGTVSSISIGIIGVDEYDANSLWLGQNIPNPTAGATNIEYNLPSAGDIRFVVMNLFGQKVYETENYASAGKHLINLNVKDLAAGIYYYTVEFKDKRLVKKMVVNK